MSVPPYLRAPIVALPLLVLIQWQIHPFDDHAPMVLEAQLDRTNSFNRRAVTACLQRDYDGTTIMASMGSLGHYMQETTAIGLPLRAYLHEGNGDLWSAASAAPAANTPEGTSDGGAGP